jgi:acetylornithine deacetylase/succinyl-diaminopimelate desuccinylase-like protein
LPRHSTPKLTFVSVDALKKPFIDRLATAVAIPSVSADASYRPQVHKMGEWLAKELKALGVEYTAPSITFCRVPDVIE